ncbi:MAG: energy coupling factor transporter S component ThiW [Firmicutes bacterium]|nr:energy coupling factor transporter S component ThiW [Bacillota bacterium]
MAQNKTKKLAVAALLVAVAVAGSLLSVPVLGSRCAPVQHMVNIISAVALGPFWGLVIAFCASLLRNLFGLGSLMAFPGSMIGALCCGLMYKFTKKLLPTCVAEALGTGILGGLAAYPVAKLLMGLNPETMTVYIIPFLISTVAGSILAYVILKIILRSGALPTFNADERKK